MTMRVLALVLLLPPLLACEKNGRTGFRDPVAGGPTDVPAPVPQLHTIEYRVTGSATRATIAFGSSQQGTTFLTTDLPWTASFTTSRSSVFVYLKATAMFDGRMTGGIFVDGTLFREATTDTSVDASPVDISGTVDFTGLAVTAP
jgi:hypothetical protein